MTVTEIHPDVRNALLHADTVQEHLLQQLEKMRNVVAEGVSEQHDIAVKVDRSGQLTDLWLKPGILDRKTAAEISRELTRLVTVAVQESSEQILELWRIAHNPPDYETVVASSGQINDAATPESALQPR